MALPDQNKDNPQHFLKGTATMKEDYHKETPRNQTEKM